MVPARPLSTGRQPARIAPLGRYRRPAPRPRWPRGRDPAAEGEAALARLLLVQPDPEAAAGPGDGRRRGDAARRERGRPGAAGGTRAPGAGDRARRRHRQLRPGDAAQGRAGARPFGDDGGQGSPARAGAGRGRLQAQRGRCGHDRGQPAGAAAPPQHPQDRHHRRLRGGRQLGDRLDHLGPAARPRQHTGPAGGDDGGRAARSWSCAAPTSRRSTTPTAPTASSPSSRCRWPPPIAGSRCCWASRS